MARASGILLPVFSLPGRFPRGTLGETCYRFIDAIADGGFTLWQTLPLTPPDAYGSPYASDSSFAMDSSLLDIDALVGEDLLSRKEAESGDHGALVSLAASHADRASLDAYLDAHPETAAYCRHRADGEEALYTLAFAQAAIDRQWESLRDYAHGRGVRIVGDLPIYVAPGSADAALYPEAFYAEGDVAGVPPDYFSPEGQVWGNPLYDWEAMRECGYSFVRARLAYLLDRFDGIRLDHFRGFSAYYRIPGGAPATEGHWEAGPGMDLFLSLFDLLSGRAVIAEDLGEVDEAVAALRRDCGFLSTRVLQFAFLGDPGSIHLPHNYTEDCVAYSGTHDNDTLQGYLDSMPESERAYLLDYCGASSREGAVSAVIRTLLASVARLAVFPMQDLLGIGGEGRINTPGRAEGNWSWRLPADYLDHFDREKYLYLNRLFGRR